MANLHKTIETEIDQYLNSSVEISDGVMHSEYKLKKRISMFKNRIYPQGKVDKQGRYKYWQDIIKSRVDSEVKNLRIDSKNFRAFSVAPQKDFAAIFTLNAKTMDWMLETGRSEELNTSVEAYSSDGNVIFKKVPGGYELTDMMNTYITNTTARTVDETAIIERHQLTQSELRAMEDVWENVDEVIEKCKGFQFSAGSKTQKKEMSSPYYEIFERNGEVSEKELFELKGLEGGREDKYVLAKVIVAGLKKGGKDEDKFTLFAEAYPSGTKMSDRFKSAHRGPYKGKFWREGLYELLFDHQVRANEIANQIARGLEWASKTIFTSADKLIAQNILTDMANGDIIKSQGGLSQVEVRMQGIDQLIADWNRNIAEADNIANSFEIIRGEAKSGTPFRLGSLLDQNASSLFMYLRQRLGIAYREVFKQWVLPELIKDLKHKEIVEVTGNNEVIDQLRDMQVEQWYRDNLVSIGPHSREMAIEIKRLKKDELKNSEPVIKNTEEIWEGVAPRVHYTITGENSNLADELETLGTLIQLELDPVRRAFLLDQVYALKNIPKPPEPTQPAQPPQVQQPSGQPTQNTPADLGGAEAPVTAE